MAPLHAVRRGADRERVEQRGGRQVGRTFHPDVAAEPGLDLPTTGALATTSSDRPASREHPGEVTGGAHRAQHRAGHLGARAGGARVVADVTLDEAPLGPPPRAAAARRGSRSGGPHAQGEQVRRDGTPASGRCRAAASPMRRRSHQSDHGVTGAGVPGPDPTARRTAPADSEVGASGDDVVEQRHQLSGIHRAVAVDHRNVVGRGGLEAGVHGGAVPRRGSLTTVAPSLRATSAVVSRDPLSTTSGWNPAGIRASRAGRAGASSRHGMMTSAHRGLTRHWVNVGRASRRRPRLARVLRCELLVFRPSCPRQPERRRAPSCGLFVADRAHRIGSGAGRRHQWSSQAWCAGVQPTGIHATTLPHTRGT